MLTYRLRIKNYTPETLPMKRLGEYLSALADLIGRDLVGNDAQVRFDRLTRGSAQLCLKVHDDYAERVENRVRQAPVSDKNSEARRGYERFNNLLREDKTSAEFRSPKSTAVILDFPGVKSATIQISLRDVCEMHGRIIRVGGRDNTVPIELRTPDGEVVSCTVDMAMAKRLIPFLYEPVDVILYGEAKWTRSVSGDWTFSDFKVSDVAILNDDGFDDTLRQIQRNGSGWDVENNPEAAWLALRHGE